MIVAFLLQITQYNHRFKSVLLLGTINAKLLFVPVNRKSLLHFMGSILEFYNTFNQSLRET